MEEVLDVFGIVESCGGGGAFGGFAFAAGFAGVYAYKNIMNYDKLPNVSWRADLWLLTFKDT